MTDTDLRVSAWEWIGLGVACLWVTVLAHEGAHYLGYFALVVPNGGPSAPMWMQMTMWASGPVVTLAMLGGACMIVARDRRLGRPASSRRRRIAVAGGVAAAVRFFVVAEGIISSLALKGRMMAAFDEKAIMGTGRAGAGLVLAEAVVGGLATLWLIQQPPREGRPRAVAWLALGLTAGVATVFTIGPMLGLPI